jgi:DNA-binding HxlR family transcriptional regulator
MESEARQIEDFLEKVGAMKLILRLDDNEGENYRDTRLNMALSPNTLQKRVSDAREINLIEERPLLPEDHKGRDRYRLTPKGAKVKEILKKYGVEELYNQKVEIEERLERVPEIVRDEFTQ